VIRINLELGSNAIRGSGMDSRLMVLKFPGGPMAYRSKLTPFEAEIAQLRRTRPPTPYSEIVRVLKERHGLAVQVSTLFNFLKVRRKWDRRHRLASQPSRSNIVGSASVQPGLSKQGPRWASPAEATPVGRSRGGSTGSARARRSEDHTFNLYPRDSRRPAAGCRTIGAAFVPKLFPSCDWSSTWEQSKSG
jgi:hypothetical protein